MYYNNGSVNHQTYAAFVCSGTTAIFHLTDGSSLTQAELVAISMALIHVEETAACPVVVFSESMTALETISQTHVSDNISHDFHPKGDAGLGGRRKASRPALTAQPCGGMWNKPADLAANEATLLPAVTIFLPSNIRHIKSSLRSKACRSIATDLGFEVARRFPSAGWYATATDRGRVQIANHPPPPLSQCLPPPSTPRVLVFYRA